MTDMTPEAVRAMTPDQAGAKLAEMKTSYDASQRPTAVDPQTQLDNFTSDPRIAEKLLAGDADVNRRFHELTAAVGNSDGTDRLAEMIVGHPVSRPEMEGVAEGELPTYAKLAAIDLLRGLGLSDGAVAEAFSGNDARSGRPFDTATVAQCRALKARLEGDPEWVKRLLSGGFEERRQLTLMSVILANAA
jgi:hypothetical protein